MGDPVTIITGVTALAGVASSGMGMAQSSSAAGDMNDAQIKELNLKKQQMELDAWQHRRQTIRNMVTAQAMALTNAQAQTGSVKGSGVQGGLSSIAAAGGVQYGNIGRALNIGEGIYDQQMNYANASLNYQMGNSMMNLGKDLVSIAPKAGQVGGYAYGSIFPSSTGGWTTGIESL